MPVNIFLKLVCFFTLSFKGVDDDIMMLFFLLRVL